MSITPIRRVAADSEKITINLGFVDLGSIDLLVKESVFANRTDFIRSAIRNELARHEEISRQVRTRDMPVLGIRHLSRAELEAARNAGEMLHLSVLGLLSVADDVEPELALATIQSLSVLGAFHASTPVKAALARRTS
jgi:Arc/MetJ-type ribon-helix-helix transcriptional regulator